MTNILKTSAIALIMASGLTAPVMAAGHAKTIADVQISDSDMRFVQVRCDELRPVTAGSIESDDQSDENNDNDDADDGDNALTTIDLDTITAQQCEEGGFYNDEMHDDKSMDDAKADGEMMMDGKAMTSTEAALVQARCDELRRSNTAGLADDNDGNTEEGDNEQADEGDNALTTIDLDSLTVAQCETNGM